MLRFLPRYRKLLQAVSGRRCVVITTLAASILALTMSSGRADVYVRVAPPPAVVEPAPPPPPGVRYVWVPGYWHWNGYRWTWRKGHYTTRPRPSAAWVPAHYSRRDGGWVYVPGHWRY
ncbi:MAG: YXWGXW repeat-containing protein [Verrucomicrobia bacterium]|nr:YXWGXW repeat-containing protein [Verrucomicrobiota bacterium]